MRRERAARAVNLVAAIGLVVGLVVANAAPVAAASGWYVVPSASPPGPPDGALSGVSCVNANYCFAVGDSENGALIEHWNGANWRFVASPKPKDILEPSLTAVTCTSTTNCFAVGSAATLTPTFGIKTLIERWDGTRWTIMPSPTPTGGTSTTVNLSAVSCASATNCFAVGSVSSITITPVISLTSTPLIEHWNGVSWSIVPSADLPDGVSARLRGVSCPGPTTCFAVGDFQGRATGGALVERWNGTAWSIVPNPDAAAATPAIANPALDLGFGSAPSLAGISCASTTSCMAVGESYSGSALIEQFDGTSWTILDSPTPRNSFGVALSSVSCASATDCSAVGSTGLGIDLGDGDGGIFVGEDGSPVTEHWNGTYWSIVPQPNGSFYNELTGVSCPTTTSCAAVGDSALAQRWNGTSWSIAPFAGKTSQSHLNQVACPSATSCFAVGGSSSNTSASTLIEHWNGKKWSIMASPEPKGAYEVELTGIACPSVKSCFAVGYASTARADQPLIERWNGRTWSIMANPAVKGAEFAELTSISCVAVNDCSAVGSSYGESDDGKPLIEHWDGKKWSIAPSPSPSGGAFQLLVGVSCTSRTDCTAVGGTETVSPGNPLSVKPLVEHWDGKKWAVVPTVAPAGVPLAILTSVSCSNADNCLAVGVSGLSVTAVTKPFVQRWNGTTWTAVKAPTPKNAVQSVLVGVTCRTARNCYAVGGYSTPSGDRTLVEHWDGNTLSVMPSPSPSGGSDTALSGIACPTPASCMAVGAYSTRNGSFTLTLRGA